MHWLMFFFVIMKKLDLMKLDLNLWLADVLLTIFLLCLNLKNIWNFLSVIWTWNISTQNLPFKQKIKFFKFLISKLLTKLNGLLLQFLAKPYLVEFLLIMIVLFLIYTVAYKVGLAQTILFWCFKICSSRKIFKFK